MRPEQKTKSRTKLYAALEGGKEIVGAAGISATGSIQFANIPLVTETVTIGGVVFGFKVGAAEAAGTSAGTAADPHLCSVDTSLDAVGISLAAQVLAETLTTGRWGFLHPIDAVGCVWLTDTLTLTFYPGTAGNSVVLAGSATDETIVLPETAALGVAAPTISPDVNVNVIDTTGNSDNQEYYTLADGQRVGQEVKVVVKTFAASSTPTILGHLKEDGVAMVEAEFITGEPGAYLNLMWDGSAWTQTGTSALNTQPDYTASA